MPKHLPQRRMAVACAAVLSFAGLAAVGTIAAQPAAAADPVQYQNIRINEVTSDGNDTVELYNVGTIPVSIAGWQVGTASNTFVKTAIPGSLGSIGAGGFATFNSPVNLAAADTVVLFTADGTLVDRVDWASALASPAMARCGGDGTGSFVTKVASTFGSTNGPSCGTIPAASNVRINEVTSAGTDTVELANSGANAVNIAAWQYIDGDVTHVLHTVPTTTPSGQSVPAGGYATFDSSPSPNPNGLPGLGGNDSVFLLDGGGNTIDTVTWPSNGATPTSYERCADKSATGVFQTSGATTFGAANQCLASGGGGGPVSTANCTGEAASGTAAATGTVSAWPGSQTATTVDNLCQWVTLNDGAGEDMSGLAFDPANPSVLWAVQNKNWLWKLAKVGGKWVPDMSFSTDVNHPGKQLFFAGDTGHVTLPDTEGLTVGPNGHIYVTSERDNAHNNVPKDTIMEFDPNSTAAALLPIHQYDMTLQFPELNTGSSTDANLGFEGVGFVPDSWLLSQHWIDPLTTLPYAPSMYPLHGSGLFFAGLEKDGTLHIYGLNADGTYITFGAIPTGQKSVMDVFYDSGSQRLVATCDNTCTETHTFLKGHNGNLVPDVVYTNPTSMPINNFEGFAISPTCVGGSRETVWTDDGNWGFGGPPTVNPATPSFKHALWGGTFPC